MHYAVNDMMEAIEIFDTNIHLFINSWQVFPGTLSNIKKILPDLEECFGSYSRGSKPQKGGDTMSPKLDVVLTWAEAIAGAVLIVVPAIRGVVSKLEAASKVALISNDEEQP